MKKNPKPRPYRAMPKWLPYAVVAGAIIVPIVLWILFGFFMAVGLSIALAVGLRSTV